MKVALGVLIKGILKVKTNHYLAIRKPSKRPMKAMG